MKRKLTLLTVLILALFITGCATVDGGTKRAPSDLTTRQTSTPSNQLVNQGLVYLRERNYEEAQKVFSAAVKLSPSSSTIHVLNGISYHLEYLKGVPDSKTLAETAYSVAYSLVILRQLKRGRSSGIRACIRSSLLKVVQTSKVLKRRAI